MVLTMASALQRCERLFSSRPAVIDSEGTFTWAEHLGRVKRAGGMLHSMGIAPGERFAIISRNTFRHFEMIHAGYWTGLVPVPINTRLAAPEIAAILNDAAPRALAVDPEFVHLLQHPELRSWGGRAFLLGEDGAGGLPAYEAMLGESPAAAVHTGQMSDDAIILYTGGTTGRGKGVRLTQLNVVSNGMQVGWNCGLGNDEVYLHVAPMFHSADLLATGVTLQGGGHAFLPQFSARNLLTAIASCGVTWTMLAPTMIILCLQSERPGDYDLSRLRRIFYGSAPMAPEWIQRTFAAFPEVELIQGYGLTETSPILTILDSAEHRQALLRGDLERLRAAGRPLVGVNLRILDASDEEVPTGEVGEVCVQGPNVTVGYLNQEEVSARALRGGWFHTGDVGRVDEEGFLYLLDRQKDMIITGGENVYSSEVEQVLYQHPDVSECAVVGVPDPVYGEALVAVIVCAPGRALTDEAIIAHCRGRIGGYKIPRLVQFVPELPKSAMGKILKTELRRLYARGTDGLSTQEGAS
jgi:long-chain acyl-CoA synthetase